MDDCEFLNELYIHCIYTNNTKYLSPFIENINLSSFNLNVINSLANNKNLSNYFSLHLQDILGKYIMTIRKHLLSNPDEKLYEQLNCLIRKTNIACLSNKEDKNMSFNNFIEDEMIKDDINPKFVKKRLLKISFTYTYENLTAYKIVNNLNECAKKNIELNKEIINCFDIEFVKYLLNAAYNYKNIERNEIENVARLTRKMK